MKIILQVKPELLNGIFNKCLFQGCFPKIWKRANLVLLEKPKKTPDDPPTFRPLCLLDSVGKLMEKILDNRIRSHLEANGELADSQYGFRKGRGTIPGLTLPGRLNHIVDTLFPRANKIVWPLLGSNRAFPEISREEIIECSLRIPLGKAPGPDGVPDMIIKEVAMRRPEILSGLFNACLEQGVFPANWKTAKLILLRKGAKPLDSPSSYRPICLLNTIGKLFERVIKGRLENYLAEANGLSDKQYGFRKGRSTVDAVNKLMETVDKSSTGPLRRRQLCAVVALDVRNAFNTARWDRIEKALHRKRVPNYITRIIQSYLSHRHLRYGQGDSRIVTCGVPQG